MNTRLSLALAATLLSGLPVGPRVGFVSPAQAKWSPSSLIVIDDFSEGALPPAHGPFEFTHVGLSPQSCAGGSRHVKIDDVPTHTAGMILLGGSDIAYQIQTSENGPGGDVFDPDVLLDYTMAAPLDLTAGGQNDRVVLDVVSVSTISVFVYVNSFGSAVGKTLVLQPGPNVLYLSDLQPFVDLTQVTRIQFFFHEFSVSGFGELTLTRIRVTGNDGRYLYFQVPDLIEYAPPFPLPGPLIEALYVDDAGMQIQTPSIGLSLESAIVLPAFPGGATPFPTSMRSSDSGVMRGGGLSAGFEFVEAAPRKSSHSDGRFEFQLALESAAGRYPTRVTLPAAQPPATDRSVYILFDVDVASATGVPIGTSFCRLRVQVPEGVPYKITQVVIAPPQQPNGLSFRFRFELHDDGGAHSVDKSEGQQLFHLALEGDFVPHPTSTATAPVVLDGGLRLSAAPSVVSDRTVLRLSRPLDRHATLQVYDLAGRAVRALRLAPSQQVLTWDGRDDAGSAVASGVYVARIGADGELATRKLVVLR